MFEDQQSQVGGSSWRCFRSVPAHRIVGGGLGRRYDHAARLSDYDLAGNDHHNPQSFLEDRRPARRSLSSIRGASPQRTVAVDHAAAQLHPEQQRESRHERREAPLDPRPPTQGGEILGAAPAPREDDVGAEDDAFNPVGPRGPGSAIGDGFGRGGAPWPREMAGQDVGSGDEGDGVYVEREGEGEGEATQEGPSCQGRDVSRVLLSTLCLETIAASWDSHATHFLPQVYLMPHELCARLLRVLVYSRKLTASSLSGFFNPTALELDLSGCSYVPKCVFKQLSTRCTRLIHLNLSMCTQVNNGVVRRVLHGCLALRQLYLDGCRHVTDAGFNLQESPSRVEGAAVSLETVSVRGCPQVTGSLVLHLRKTCRELKELDLARCKSIDGASVRRVFESCPALQSLNVSFLETAVLSDALESLEKFLPRSQAAPSALASTPGADGLEPRTPPAEATPGNPLVVDVDLGVDVGVDVDVHEAAPVAGGTHEAPSAPGASHSVSPPMISGEHVASLANPGPDCHGPLASSTFSVPPLRHLNVGGCEGITDAALASVAKAFPTLEGINLEHCLEFSDAGLRSLAKGCRSLRALGLYNCGQITDDAMEALSRHCPALEWLDISWCGYLTDDGVERLAGGCPWLEELRAVWCEGLTDASLDSLSRLCTNLEALNVRLCRGITRYAVQALRRRGVEVLFH